MSRREAARYDCRVAAWFARMRNTTVDVAAAGSPSRPVKVMTISGANELGIWWDHERGSTFIRKWGQVRADMKPARSVAAVAR